MFAVVALCLAVVLGPWVSMYVALRASKMLVHSSWWDRRASRQAHDIDSDSSIPPAPFRPLAEVELALHRLRDP